MQEESPRNWTADLHGGYDYLFITVKTAKLILALNRLRSWRPLYPGAHCGESQWHAALPQTQNLVRLQISKVDRYARHEVLDITPYTE